MRTHPDNKLLKQGNLLKVCYKFCVFTHVNQINGRVSHVVYGHESQATYQSWSCLVHVCSEKLNIYGKHSFTDGVKFCFVAAIVFPSFEFQRGRVCQPDNIIAVEILLVCLRKVKSVIGINLYYPCRKKDIEQRGRAFTLASPTHLTQKQYKVIVR